MQQLVRIISIANDWIGRGVALLVLGMMGMLCWEVFVRHVLGAPTIWAHEMTMHFFGVHGVLGGAYVILRGEHVRLDMVYLRLSRKWRIICDSVCLLLFWLLMAVIVYWGLQFALHSLRWNIRVFSPFASPVWPARATIPVAAFLLLLQGTIHYIQKITTTLKEGN